MTRTPVSVTLVARSIDDLCDLIEAKDLSLQGVADLWGCTKRQLQLWIDGDKTRVHRAKEARENAADWADRQAEKVLIDLKPGATPAEIAQARELAAHYRWRARVRNPATHGDKITVDHKRTMDPAEMSDAELAFIASSGGLTIDGDAEIVSPLVRVKLLD